METRGRRPPGSGTITELDGRYRGQKTVSGKKLSTPWMRTEALAERELKKLSPSNAPSATFGKSFELFLAARGHTTTTSMEYQRLVDIHLVHLKNRKIADLDVEDFGAVLKNLSKTKSKSTLNQVKVCVTGSYIQAIGKGWVTQNVGQLLRLPATREPTPHKGLTPLQSKNVGLYLMTSGERLASCYLIGIRYGLRPNERRGLQWKSVFLDEPKPYILIEAEVIDERGTGTVFYPRVKTPQAHRRIYLDDDSHRMLKLHKAATANREPLWTDAIGNTPDLVWRQEDGNPITTSFERRYFRKVQTAAGVPKQDLIPPYGMRHSAATVMLAPYDAELGTLGLDVYTVSRILGHKDIQLVTTVYAKKQHATQEGAADAYNRSRTDRQVRLD
jgi:integrase